MGEWASSNGADEKKKCGKQENIIARNLTLSKNAYYEELKLISDAEKNTMINMTEKFCNLIVTKLVLGVRKLITSNR